MQTRTRLMALMFALVVLLMGTSSVFAQVQATDCMSCHDDTTVITGKSTGLSEAVHGTGESYVRGTRSSCAGCHSGGAFSAMVAAGLGPNQVEAGDPNPTRQDCRTCHQIHVGYTVDDWALETIAPVNLYAFGELMFDGGKGNLCATCHQPRRQIAAPDPNDNIAVTSTHWGPHHGPQSAMLLGTGGAGGVAGVPSFHYRLTTDTCVTCHIGPDMVHTFEAVESSCLDCHTEEEDLDGAMAAVDALIVELHDLLEAKGLYHDGHPVVGVYPAAEAQALWNYIFIAVEDGSSGAHNPPYTRALLEASIAALQ
ncbi:MAG: cytochrome c3 family protein [Planctomycetota bacterium]